MKQDIKSLLVLLLVAMLSGFVLSLTYKATSTRIRQNELQEKNEALLSVVPEKGLDLEQKDDVMVFKKAGQIKYYASTGEAPGYSSIVKVAVGFTPEGKITAIKIISQQETPGLGAECEKPEFSARFQGKVPEYLTVVKDRAKENEVEALTGATITSNAVVSAVKNAYEKVEKYKGKKQ